MTPEEMIAVYKKNGGDVQLYEAWEIKKLKAFSDQPKYNSSFLCDLIFDAGLLEEIITMLIDKYSADFIRDKIIERLKEKK